MRPFSLNIRGHLCQYAHPAVMGILNVTPDSFYSGSRAQTFDEIKEKALQMVTEGADFIDIGAYSTRPDCMDVSTDEEIRRLELGLEAIRAVSADIPVSVDTFRAEVAKKAIKELGADIVNDISAGELDDKMFETMAELRVPYIMMHMRGTPLNMMDYTEYDNLLPDILRELAIKTTQLDLLGVNDVIIDPGFGFSKTLEQNYVILRHLDVFEIFHMPILVGLSRKSMATKLLGITADEALNATTALNICALQRGASILRVHDVAPALQAVKIFRQL